MNGFLRDHENLKNDQQHHLGYVQAARINFVMHVVSRQTLPNRNSHLSHILPFQPALIG